MSTASPHEEEALGKAYDGVLMRRLLGYARPYRLRVVAAVLVLMVGAGIEALAGPWLTKIALDRAVPQRDFELLGWLAAAYAAALIAGFFLEYAETMITTRLGQQIMFDLRREIFGKLQRLGVAFYDRNPVGRLMTRATGDVESLSDLFSSGIVTVFGDLFTLLYIAAAMFLIDWRLALVTLAITPMVFIAVFAFRARMRDAFREIRTRLARLNAFLQERITGIAVVRLFGQEARTLERFRAVDSAYLDAHLRSVRYYALFFPVIEFLTTIAVALIIVYGGWQVLEGTLTVGTVAAFLLWGRRFFRPIQDISDKYNMLQGAMASSERIFNLLDEEEAPGRSGTRNLPVPGRGEIEFRDVWFSYGSSAQGEPAWVLKGLSFHARPGERVAVVGHTGAGKTTLIGLLMRFYEPQRGEILFDGVPIRDVPVAELRSRIGLVLQDVFLFSRSVAYNVGFGSSVDEERITRAVDRIGASELVSRLPRGIAEPLGERGASISGGERQLLSFARALAADPLVLVLDEATSSVDSELEAGIERAVSTLMEGRTALVIAHRLSTIQTADRILVLHHGELREQGTHAELLARGGLYARLHELQFVGAPGVDPVRSAV